MRQVWAGIYIKSASQSQERENAAAYEHYWHLKKRIKRFLFMALLKTNRPILARMN